MSDTETSPPLVLGRITGAWGVKGWVRIHPFGDEPAGWAKMPKLWLGHDDPAVGWQEFELQQLRPHGDGVVAQLVGVTARGDAEALAGRLVGAPRESLPPPAEGEYYWGDLIGLTVANREGEQIGEVSGLIETGANDVLVVAGADGREKLLPFVGDVVLDVDRAARRIVVAWGADW